MYHEKEIFGLNQKIGQQHSYQFTIFKKIGGKTHLKKKIEKKEKRIPIFLRREISFIYLQKLQTTSISLQILKLR